MKKYSIFLFISFFFLINNVHAEYYLIPNTFDMTVVNGSQQFDFYGINNGIMSSVYTLAGNNDRNFRFEFDLDGSNCAINTDSSACFDTIHAIEDGGKSNTIFGYFSMCVSKPQFHYSVNWTTCNDNCLKKSQDLTIINNSYKNCTLGLYDTETDTNMENDGYLVRVYFDIAKWQYVEGAYSGRVNGRINLHNDSESVLYYRFVNDVVLSDRDMASWDSGYGIFNHDYSNPDIGGETFLNDGTCVRSYNKMDNYSYTNNWNRNTSTLTFNNNLPYEKLPGGKNLFNKTTSTANKYFDANGNINNSSVSSISDYISVGSNKQYTIQGYVNTDYYKCVVFYDNNKIFLSSSCVGNNRKYFTVTTPNNTAYLRFHYPTSNQNIIQLEQGSYSTSYMPYGGYYVTYNNLQTEMAIFHYYDTNLTAPGNIYVYYENYNNNSQLIDLVNCRNSYVCKYENIYSFSHLSNILDPSKDWVKTIKLYWTGDEPIYFEKPYIFDLYEVPGRATWKEYYQPFGTYICSNNENGTFYNAQNKEVYYNPDSPPKIVSSNPNGQSQNIFGIEVDFYGLSGLFSIPIEIINDIKNGSYNTCQPLDIPFPGFPNKNLQLPCMTSYVYERYPTLLSIYRVIIYGFISIRIGIGTLKYIKKWYDGTIESGD